jgi:hypothetical protein
LGSPCGWWILSCLILWRHLVRELLLRWHRSFATSGAKPLRVQSGLLLAWLLRFWLLLCALCWVFVLTAGGRFHLSMCYEYWQILNGVLVLALVFTINIRINNNW